MSTEITDDLAPEILAALQSIDSKLDTIPTTLLDEERRARKRAQRILTVALVLLAVLVFVVAAIFVQREHDRSASTRESRCGIRRAVASVIDVAEEGTPPDSPGRIVGDRIIARINHDLPANCHGG